MPDLPQYATPWRDPLGNEWCVTPYESDNFVAITEHSRVGNEWTGDMVRSITIVNADLLRGIGRECPPIAPPKKVAIPAKVKDSLVEFALKGDAVFFRYDNGDWIKDAEKYSSNNPGDRSFFIAIGQALQQGGDVLPGEE